MCACSIQPFIYSLSFSLFLYFFAISFQLFLRFKLLLASSLPLHLTVFQLLHHCYASYCSINFHFAIINWFTIDTVKNNVHEKCTIDLCRCSSIGLYSVNSVLFLYSFFIDCFFFGFYRLLHELIMTCDKYGLGKSNKIFINYKCTYNLFICVLISYSFQMEIDNKKKIIF